MQLQCVVPKLFNISPSWLLPCHLQFLDAAATLAVDPQPLCPFPLQLQPLCSQGRLQVHQCWGPTDGTRAGGLQIKAVGQKAPPNDHDLRVAMGCNGGSRLKCSKVVDGWGSDSQHGFKPDSFSAVSTPRLLQTSCIPPWQFWGNHPKCWSTSWATWSNWYSANKSTQIQWSPAAELHCVLASPSTAIEPYFPGRVEDVTTGLFKAKFSACAAALMKFNVPFAFCLCVCAHADC